MKSRDLIMTVNFAKGRSWSEVTTDFERMTRLITHCPSQIFSYLSSFTCYFKFFTFQEVMCISKLPARAKVLHPHFRLHALCFEDFCLTSHIVDIIVDGHLKISLHFVRTSPTGDLQSSSPENFLLF